MQIPSETDIDIDTDTCLFSSSTPLQHALRVCGKMAHGAPSVPKITKDFVPATLVAESTPGSGRDALRRGCGTTEEI
jgi:hypothetical protein